MKANMFKAGRRIALALCVVWPAGCAVYGIFAKPYAYLTYSVSALGATPVRAHKCALDDGSRDISIKDVEGNPVGVRLCFKTLKAQPRRWWTEASYSPEVVRQMDEFEEGFRLPPQGIAEAERMHREQHLEQWKYAAIAAVSGMALIGVLVFVVGWVVRGVLGIPRGQDARRLSPSGTAARGQRSRHAHAEPSQRIKRRTKRYE